MYNMQQNNHNNAKLLDEFQLHTQPKIRQKQVWYKSSTTIFGQPNISRKIPLAGRMAVKKFSWGSNVEYKSVSEHVGT